MKIKNLFKDYNGEDFEITGLSTNTKTIKPGDLFLCIKGATIDRHDYIDEAVKNGAKAFIDIIDEATDSSKDGQIGSGSHIGIVSFSGVVTKDTGMITSVAEIKAAVDALSVDSFTNH